VEIDREFFEERAAIRQFDGGMTPAEARIAALQDVRQWQADLVARFGLAVAAYSVGDEDWRFCEACKCETNAEMREACFKASGCKVRR